MLSETNMPCGVYKEHDNVIMETGCDGSRRVRFAPTPAAETAETMERLILAYMAARDDSDINSLLPIPCFALDFLCMRPFSDGNERISRLLSLLLSCHKGFDYVGSTVRFLLVSVSFVENEAPKINLAAGISGGEISRHQNPRTTPSRSLI
jgi:hypothetical protein